MMENGSPQSTDADTRRPVLVTGATGHTGSRLVRALLQRGDRVRILTREPDRMKAQLRKQVEVVRGDVTVPADVLRAVTGCRAVLATTHIKYASAIIAAMQQAGVARGVFMSSTRRYTRFVEETARQVMAGEDAVERSGLEWTIIRPTMIYGGPQDNNLERLLQTLKRWPIFPLPGGGKMLWQPVFTWDVVAAILASLDRPGASVGKSYTVAGPQAITYKSMLQTMLAQAGLRRMLVPVPLGFVKTLVGLYEKAAKRPSVQTAQIQRMEEDKDFDISDAQRDLGFAPVTFEEGIRRKVQRQA